MLVLGPWVAPEVTGERKDMSRSSSCTTAPSDGFPTRNRDFWYAWTCSCIECAMADLKSKYHQNSPEVKLCQLLTETRYPDQVPARRRQQIAQGKRQGFQYPIQTDHQVLSIRYRYRAVMYVLQLPCTRCTVNYIP